MSPLPQPRSDFAFPWSVDHDPQNRLLATLERVYGLFNLPWRGRPRNGPVARLRLGHSLDQAVFAAALIVLPKALSGWDALRPILRAKAQALLPLVPRPTAQDEAVARDPAWEILAEFQALSPDQQDKAARNLALLWDHFEQTFSGLSGFLAEPQPEQALYLDKLAKASQRMKLARGSEVAFHFVTVELMRLYVDGLALGRRDRAALSLAAAVSMLIDRGRMLTPALTF